MSFQVRFTPTAEEDLQRLYLFLLQRAEYVEELEVAERALQAIEAAIKQLAQSPFIHRRAESGDDPLRRELLIPFGGAGYLALFEIIPPDRVLVLTIRHLLERDY